MTSLMGDKWHLNIVFICIYLTGKKVRYSLIFSRAILSFWIFCFCLLLWAWNLVWYQDCKPSRLAVCICLINLGPLPLFLAFSIAVSWVHDLYTAESWGFALWANLEVFGLIGKLGSFSLTIWLLCLLSVPSSVVITEGILFTVSLWKEGSRQTHTCVCTCIHLCVCVCGLQEALYFHSSDYIFTKDFCSALPFFSTFMRGLYQMISFDPFLPPTQQWMILSCFSPFLPFLPFFQLNYLYLFRHKCLCILLQCLIYPIFFYFFK